MRGSPERGGDLNFLLSVPIDHLPFSQLDVNAWVASCGMCVTVSNRDGAEDQTAGSRLVKVEQCVGLTMRAGLVMELVSGFGSGSAE